MKIKMDEIKGKAGDALKKTKEVAVTVKDKTVETSKKVVKAAPEKYNQAKEKTLKAMDQNGDGELTIEDVIIAGLKVPGIKIKRDKFLKSEFSNKHKPDVVTKIIEETPSRAGVDTKEIDKIADDVIQYERLRVSGISTALSIPGGVAMVATLPADIAQFYGYMLRAMQKLLYLYGFPELDVSKEEQIDSATMNTIIVCMGVMYGIKGANTALKAMGNALGRGVEKKLVNTALTKGTIYPIVKSTAKWFGYSMTKKAFSQFFGKAIPVVGGVIGGGITYATFKPCCEKLKNTLKNTMLANPNLKSDIDIETIEFTEVEPKEE